MLTKTLKVVPIREFDEGGVSLIPESDIDKAYLNSFSLIDLGYSEKVRHVSRPILCIKHGKIKIYRRFLQGSNKKINKNSIGLNRQDLHFLKGEKGSIEEVEVSLVNFWGLLKYYWYNPKEDIRFAMKSAIIILIVTEILDFLKK